MKQHLGKVSVGHDELWDQVNIVITVGAQIGGGFPGLELPKKVRQIQRGSVTTVVVVSVHLKNLLALHTEETRDNTLLKAGSENNGIVFSICKRFHSLGKPVKCLQRSQKQTRSDSVISNTPNGTIHGETTHPAYSTPRQLLASVVCQKCILTDRCLQLFVFFQKQDASIHRNWGILCMGTYGLWRSLFVFHCQDMCEKQSHKSILRVNHIKVIVRWTRLDLLIE